MNAKRNLYKAILALNNENECARFLRDLLTVAEIDEFANRWKVANMLNDKISYEEIAQIMDISIDSCYKTVYRAIKTIREEAEKIMNIPDSLVFFILSNLSYKELLRKN